MELAFKLTEYWGGRPTVRRERTECARDSRGCMDNLVKHVMTCFNSPEYMGCRWIACAVSSQDGCIPMLPDVFVVTPDGVKTHISY